MIGFSYPEWSKTLYANERSRSLPRGATQLMRYAANFNAVEINTTFYSPPKAEVLHEWLDSTPKDFRFCFKMSRDVTHGPTPPGSLAASTAPAGHYSNPYTSDSANRFLERLQPISAKLGGVLLQFPPRFASDRFDEFREFVRRLDRSLPLAIEFRHKSWWNKDTESLLREHSISWVATDESPMQEVGAADGIPPAGRVQPAVPTADFLYIRLIGVHEQFPDRLKEHIDPSPRLQWWTDRLKLGLERNPRLRHVYVFFDNDFAGHAPDTASRFLSIAGVPPPPAPPREATLFG